MSSTTLHGVCPSPILLDERGTPDVRTVFGTLLRESVQADCALLRIRLASVDLTAAELATAQRIRVLVAEVNAQAVADEAYALLIDRSKRANLSRILALLEAGTMEIRSAPLGGWSPDFTVFSSPQGPRRLLIGLHWFRRPFPHRGPAWAVVLGEREAHRARQRFARLWRQSHNIGPAVQQLLLRTAGELRLASENQRGEGPGEPSIHAQDRRRQRPRSVDTPGAPR